MIHHFKGLKGSIVKYFNYFSSCRKDELNRSKYPLLQSLLLLEDEISLKAEICNYEKMLLL